MLRFGVIYLSAHADSNAAIVVGGTNDGMVFRLEGSLRKRKLDLLVRRTIEIEALRIDY